MPFDVKVTGHGRPVVFIPDLATSGDIWDTTLEHLDGDVEAHVLTLAGFAGQPPIKGPYLPQIRDGLAHYLRAHGLKGTVIVGHMFGAAVAYALAASDPDLLAGVVAIDVLPCQAALGEPGQTKAAAIAEAHTLRDQIAAIPPQDFGKASAHRLATMVHDPAIAARLADDAGHSTPWVAADAYLALMTLDVRPALATLATPFLFIATDGTYAPEDWPVIEASWHRQIDSIPHHELVIIRDSRHYVMFDQPEAFFAALDHFLAALPGAK